MAEDSTKIYEDWQYTCFMTSAALAIGYLVEGSGIEALYSSTRSHDDVLVEDLSIYEHTCRVREVALQMHGTDIRT